jgi:predicted 3-demethylubiquinone-9 3-methyltransferase (glyoxalase superfamily)
MQKITPFLWFNNNAEEAVLFYTSIFRNAEIGHMSRYGAGGPGPEGLLMSATFHLEGQNFIALNGGPGFPFTPAISLFVDCTTQEEVDEYWERLSQGGSKGKCGWLTDKFGLSWQIIPSLLGQLMQDPDPAKAKRVMDAMLQMDKIDINVLLRAWQQ